MSEFSTLSCGKSWSGARFTFGVHWSGVAQDLGGVVVVRLKLHYHSGLLELKNLFGKFGVEVTLLCSIQPYLSGILKCCNFICILLAIAHTFHV